MINISLAWWPLHQPTLTLCSSPSILNFITGGIASTTHPFENNRGFSTRNKETLFSVPHTQMVWKTGPKALVILTGRPCWRELNHKQWPHRTIDCCVTLLNPPHGWARHDTHWFCGLHTPCLQWPRCYLLHTFCGLRILVVNNYRLLVLRCMAVIILSTSAHRVMAWS